MRITFTLTDVPGWFPHAGRALASELTGDITEEAIRAAFANAAEKAIDQFNHRSTKSSIVDEYSQEYMVFQDTKGIFWRFRGKDTPQWTDRVLVAGGSPTNWQDSTDTWMEIWWNHGPMKEHR